ncbi:MAG: signal peptidase II [Candidatus Peribacteraceae bacterium]|nr:signal peptidase II [Candidatus Peribacteraceae bacterium]
MRLLWVVTILAFMVSALAAVLAETFLAERIAIIGAFAGLQLSLNPGIAFGIRFMPFLQMLAITVALAAVIWVAVRSLHTQLQDIAFGLIIGGGLANLHDRLTDGVVTDFFQVGRFPIFNVADSCITIGVLILLLEMLVLRKRH